MEDGRECPERQKRRAYRGLSVEQAEGVALEEGKGEGGEEVVRQE